MTSVLGGDVTVEGKGREGKGWGPMDEEGR